MRVLFISSWFPYPPDNGARIRTFNLIKRLARDHDITLLSFYRGEMCEARLAAMAGYAHAVHVVPYREFRPNRLRALGGFFAARPRSLVDTYNSEMQALVDRVVADVSDEPSADGSGDVSTNVAGGQAFDVIVACEMTTALYVASLSQFPRVLEDVELAVIYEQAARARSPVARVRYGLTWWKLSRYVARLLREFAGCTVVSAREQELIERIVPSYEGLAIVPNGVDLEVNSGDFGAPKPDTLIYSGALTYDANFDAMAFFLRDVLPLIRARRPNVHLRITGGYKGVPVDKLPLGAGVELTGYLEDIRPAVAQSWVCVVPLRVGAGTRLKILEAMALGTPVVSTSKGAEGLEVTPGEDILIADEPEEFADGVLRLLGDRDVRARLSINGRRLVEEKYSWERCGGRLERLLVEVSSSSSEESLG